MQDVGILCDLAQSSRFTVYSYVLLGWDNGSLSLMPYVNYYRSFTLSDCLSLCDEIFIFYTFSALENFIRAKYEQKKYLAKEWVPPKPVVPKEV